VSRTYISPTLRRLVRDRAHHCCEYCLINEAHNFLPFEVDHIIAEKHNGETIESNLCWSCSTCNGYKGSDVASYDSLTMELTPLFNPRIDKWEDHFRLNEAEIIPKTAIGRVTVAILKLNQVDRLLDREGFITLGDYPCRGIEK